MMIIIIKLILILVATKAPPPPPSEGGLYSMIMIILQLEKTYVNLTEGTLSSKIKILQIRNLHASATINKI